MLAREYFESIRDSVRSMQQASDMLERLRAKEGAKAQSYAPAMGGDYSDPMDAIAARIDLEGRLDSRRTECEREIDQACQYLYGTDGRGGLASLRGARYADAVCMVYLQCQPYDEAADIMRCSKRWVRELCDAAFAYIDAVGWAELVTA